MPGMAGRELAPDVLIVRLAGAEDDPGRVERRRALGASAAIRSRPFLIDHPGDHADERPVRATPASPARPYRARSSALLSALSRQVRAALYGAGRSGSRAGSHCFVSMPFRMPTRSAARLRRMPSNPNPNSGVWISSAYFGLTVVMTSRVVDAALEEADPSPEFETVRATGDPTADRGAAASRARRVPGTPDCES